MFHGKSTKMSQFAGLFVAVAFLFCSCMAQCPATGDEVDAEKFSGNWYAMSVIRPEHQPLTKCGRLSVEFSSEGNNMTYTAINIKTNNMSIFTIDTTLNEDFTGTWSMEKPRPKFLGTFKQRIIESDYESHLVFLGCDDSSDVKFVMILSREKMLLPEILEKLKNAAGEFVDIGSFVDVDQSC